MAQDPFAKYAVSGNPKTVTKTKDDPFSKYAVDKIEPEEVIKPKTLNDYEFVGATAEEPSLIMNILKSIGDAITMPVTDAPTRLAKEYADKVSQSTTHPLANFGAGALEGVANLIPTSPGGIGLTTFGAPIARGALKVASKVPGLNKVVEAGTKFLTKERSLPFTSKSAKTIEKVSPKVVAPLVDDAAAKPTVVHRGKTNFEDPEIPDFDQYDVTLPDGSKTTVGIDKLKEMGLEIPKPPKPKVRMNLDGTISPIDDLAIKLDVNTGLPFKSPVDKLKSALTEAKPLTREQKKIYEFERSEKFAKARSVNITDAKSAGKFMGSLAGQHTKVTMQPLKLDQTDVDGLHAIIGNQLKNDIIGVPESAQSITSLKKLLSGSVPTPSELEVLGRVFGKELIEKIPKTLTAREMILKTVSIPKALVTAIDFGVPFREGINHVGRKEWFGIFRPMVESYFSGKSTDKWLNILKSDPKFNLQRRSGLAMYDELTHAREESVLNSFVANLPGVKHGNRTRAIGLSKLRQDLWNTMYRDYDRLYTSTKKIAGDSQELLDAAESLNPNTLFRQKIMSDMINTSSGRGSIGRLEPIAEELNATVFAPRLMASRFKSINRMLNPMSYYNGDPIQRKEGLKQLLSITATALTSAAMFKMAGGDVQLDPKSSDFLKGRIGKTRFDLGGGYLQYIVPTAKILSGAATSTKTGQSYNLGESPVGQNKWDVFEQFFTNKASPLASLFISFMRGKEPSGKEVDFNSLSPFENTALKTLMPIMIQDFKELTEEDPTLLPLLIPSSFGGSVQVHDDTTSTAGRRR